MNLEEELKRIWDKYDSQRIAERDAQERDRQAHRELVEFNRRRAELGLVPVAEYRDRDQYGGLAAVNPGAASFMMPAPKTWRDELDAEILVTVKRHFSG